jgi:hypothetical protein
MGQRIERTDDGYARFDIEASFHRLDALLVAMDAVQNHCLTTISKDDERAALAVLIDVARAETAKTRQRHPLSRRLRQLRFVPMSGP